VNSFSTAPHYPDGMAFSADATSSTLYSNNNDGTISRYVMGPGYMGAPAITDIATGAGAYGDLASVGRMRGVSNRKRRLSWLHAGWGTNWDNAVTNDEPSIVRIHAGEGWNSWWVPTLITRSCRSLPRWLRWPAVLSPRIGARHRRLDARFGHKGCGTVS
jgi:hypothetical protein